MKRYKKLKNGYVYDRRLLLACLTPLALLLSIAVVDAVNSPYTFYAEVECTSGYCDNPFYGTCPWYVERQMPSLCWHEKIQAGVYGAEPEVPLEWLYLSLTAGFGLFFATNHLWHNKEGPLWK